MLAHPCTDLHFRCLGSPTALGKPNLLVSRQGIPLVHSIEQHHICREAHGIGRRTCMRASPEQAPEDGEKPDKPVELVLDWRQFRANLVAQAAVEKGDPVGPDNTIWSSRWSEHNLYLLQQQDRKLAQEGLWAHSLEVPEKGGVLLASPSVGESDRQWQWVVMLIDHGPQGTRGLIMNRVTPNCIGDFILWSPLQHRTAMSDERRLKVQRVFEDCRVYHGGAYAPSEISKQIVTVVHGQSHLKGSREIIPGVYVGGEEAAAEEVLSGRLGTHNFRFFTGALEWPAGALEAEIQMGRWIPAACSRSLMLKQCLELPVPLWREIMCLMGEPYASQARRRHI